MQPPLECLQHDGGRRRRIQIYGLCEIRLSADYNCNGCEHGDSSNCVSVFSLINNKLVVFII